LIHILLWILLELVISIVQRNHNSE
jgi:hypothetical protein